MREKKIANLCVKRVEIENTSIESLLEEAIFLSESLFFLIKGEGKEIKYVVCREEIYCD